MTESNSNGRLQCPNCEARLALPADNQSPFIRCGICQVLFQTEIEPSEFRDVRTPYPSATPGDSSTFGNSSTAGDAATPRSVADRRTANRPQTPSPEFNWSRPDSGRRTTRWTTGSICLIALLFFGFLIFTLVSWAEHSHSSRSGYGYRTRPTTRTSDYNSTGTASDYPRFELDLSDAKNTRTLNSRTESIIVDGRSLSANESRSIKYLKKLRKLQYSNAKLSDDDMDLLRLSHLTTLDLNHSEWPEEIVFSKDSHPNLVNLNLAHTSVRNLFKLHECRRLSTLKLQGSNVNDSSIRSLLTHKNLRYLDVSGTKVTAAGLLKLKCPKLDTLRVSPGVLTSDQRRQIRNKNSDLRVLIVSTTGNL